MIALTPARKIGLAIAGVIFALDQLSKWLVTGPLGVDQLGESRFLLPIFNFTYAENTGVSLNLFAAESAAGRWALVAVTAAVALTVLVWLLREVLLRDIVGLALVLGGALGNILDRVRLGHVVDFADLHFGEFRPFLIFNVADAAITIGVLIILARSLLSREKRPQPADTASET
ncbi:MAG: signal peptidase II [Novosphingobium sp.]